jgi:hypothetical protein
MALASPFFTHVDYVDLVDFLYSCFGNKDIGYFNITE